MKIRFDSSKERKPTHDQGLKVLYAPGKRVAFQLRWYLILLLVASPLLWFVVKLTYGAWIIEAPAQVLLPVAEVRARDAAQVSRLTVKEGDKVQAGQVLMGMDNPEWRQRLGQLQSLSDGTERLAQPADKMLRSVLLRQLDRARERLALVQRLLQEGAATQGEALAAATERDQREAELLAFDQREALLRQQPAAGHDAAMQKADQVWLQSRLDGLQVKARENATVAEILVHEGENVGAGTVLMRLESVAAPTVWVYLDPADGAYATPGQALKLRFPDGQWLAAKVVSTADRAHRLPDDLRTPFSGAQSGLLVPVEVDGAFPSQWLINQLPLRARFPRELWGGHGSAK